MHKRTYRPQADEVESRTSDGYYLLLALIFVVLMSTLATMVGLGLASMA